MNDDFINLTAIGKLYGVSAADAGRWLKNLSLRHPDGRPTQQAVTDGFAQEQPSAFGSSWLWNKAKVCEVLDMMEYHRAGEQAGYEDHGDFVIFRGR
jgi:hypothetical protein